MIECTLQEAIKRCRENGGIFFRKDLWGTPRHKQYVWIPNEIVLLEGKCDTLWPSVDDILATWIYEPPKQSAFQKWNSETEPRADIFQHPECRKEGWNALSNHLVQVSLYHWFNEEPYISVDQIKELKEP